MEPVKNRDRRKFLACLNPIAVDDYGPVYDAASPPEYGGGRRRKKNKGRRSFSGAMKAVFSKASVKKFRGKRSKQDSTRSNSDVSCDKFKELSDHEEIFTTSNSRATSRSSSISSNSGSERMTRGLDYFDSVPKNMKKKEELNIKKDISNHLSIYSPSISGMCIFLVCLLTLVFWGKVFAIIACTSTWLFLAPDAFRSSKRVISVANEVGDSEKDKKRVIMEGFLERTHPRIYS